MKNDVYGVIARPKGEAIQWMLNHILALDCFVGLWPPRNDRIGSLRSYGVIARPKGEAIQNDKKWLGCVAL